MKKGFTLIELLAVIVILAVIALIATPIIINIINDTRIESQKRSIDNYAKALENELVRSQMYSNNAVNIDTAIENMTYNGSRVNCETRKIQSNGTIYLDNCSVDGNLVENYSYGQKKNETAPMILTGTTANNKITGYTLAKDGNIGLDIYANVSGNSHITYSVNGTDAITVNPKQDKEGKTYYTISVGPVNIAYSIAIKLYSGDTEVDTLTTSVKEYCNSILGNSSYADSHELMKAVVTFGRAAQVYFNTNTSNLADSILSTPVDLASLNINLDYYKQFQYKTRKNAIDGLSLTTSVGFEKIPMFYIYYELEEGLDIEDFAFEYAGKALAANEGSDAYGTYYLSTLTFTYADITNELKVTITKNGQTETEAFAPVGYAVSMIEKRGYTGMGALSAAMIYYYQEANSYYYN